MALSNLTMIDPCNLTEAWKCRAQTSDAEAIAELRTKIGLTRRAVVDCEYGAIETDGVPEGSNNNTCLCYMYVEQQ